MSDYISREELLKDLYSREYTNFQSRDFIALVQYQDKADVRENIHGEWDLLDECSNSGYYCSICHKKVVKEGWSDTVKKIKFCPNCGADMRGNQNETDN
jgi:hypothetical protein